MSNASTNDPAVDLLQQWQTLLARHATDAARAAATGRAVIAAWDESHRRYHTLTHLKDVLTHVDELADQADDPDAVRFAAWYHDVVYRGQSDDEHDSACRAEHDLTALGLPPALVSEVARLVRLTARHDPAPGDRNGETLCDADLAILAAPPDRYAAYTASIRTEYAHLDDATFRMGRAQILQALLDAPALYRNPTADARWTAQARANLRAELDELGAAGSRPS